MRSDGFGSKLASVGTQRVISVDLFYSLVESPESSESQVR